MIARLIPNLLMFVTLAARAEKIEDRPQCFSVTIIQHPDRKETEYAGISWKMKLRTGKAPFRAGSSLLYIDISQLFKLQLQLKIIDFSWTVRVSLCLLSHIGAAAARGARHSGAPMLRRYAATSALLRSMASWSAVLPPLRGR